MLKMSKLSMVFNLAGAAAALVVVTYAVNSMLTEQTVAPCSTRYPTPTGFSTRTNEGALMSAIDLQSRMGPDEWGVLNNVEIIKGKANDVLQVRLAEGTGSPHQATAPQGGVAFSWAPETLRNADRACLAYNVMVPKDFEFSTAGMLPGLFGGERIDRSGDTGFATRLIWRQDGALHAVVRAPTLGRNGRTSEPVKAKLDKGRWVKVETEVVLNTPGKKNGMLRLWLDGDLKVDRKDMSWRTDRGTTVAGVLGDVAYGDLDNTLHTTAPKDTAVRMTPFELSWR
jgi:hypothetical protein